MSACTTTLSSARGRPSLSRFFQYLHVYGYYTLAEPSDLSLTCPIDHASNAYPNSSPLFKHSLGYSVQEAAKLLGVDYFSVYRLIQRGKLRACRALRGKLLVPH